MDLQAFAEVCALELFFILISFIYLVIYALTAVLIYIF